MGWGRNTDLLPPIHALTGNWTCNLGWLENELTTVGVLDDAPNSWATWVQSWSFCCELWRPRFPAAHKKRLWRIIYFINRETFVYLCQMPPWLQAFCDATVQKKRLGSYVMSKFITGFVTSVLISVTLKKVSGDTPKGFVLNLNLFTSSACMCVLYEIQP